jgi:hypothetical protein
VPDRWRHARQSRRPIPQQTKAAGSGDPSLEEKSPNRLAAGASIGRRGFDPLQNAACAAFAKIRNRGRKRRSVTLFRHIDSPRTRYFEHGGDDAMHFTNYIVLGLLIVCMLSAAAMVFSREKSH